MTAPEAVPFPPRPPQLPEVVALTPDSMALRLTTNEMRKVAEATGKDLTDLLGEEAGAADRFQTVIWVKLRREGHDLTWEQAGDIVVEFAEPDPTSGGPSTSSPPSADSGA